jgi:hypothetical protein
MRKRLTTVCNMLIFLIAVSESLAQNNTFPTTGNVGVGTLSPFAKLDVRGVVFVRNVQSEAVGEQLRIGRNDGDIRFHSIYSKHSGIASSNFIEFRIHNGGQGDFKSQISTMTIKGDGKVGIGTTNPTYNLQVAGNTKWTGTGSSYTEVNTNASGPYLRQYTLDGSTMSWLIRGYSEPGGVQAVFNQGGIHVNGTVKTKEVNVTAAGWADYVFQSDYRLMPLSELADFIQEKGHLPNVPTTVEVMENGVNLAEMNVILLEKVEELTLYILRQEKMIQELNAKIGDY